MGRYDFECGKCNLVYDEIVPYDETGKYKGVKCPQCGSKKKSKLFTSCNFSFSNPVGTDRWNSDANGHDYRFKHNLPNVLEQRKAAEMASHMGAQPYNKIDDLNNDKAWGKVK